jgi:hypothetical protein
MLGLASYVQNCEKYAIINKISVRNNTMLHLAKYLFYLIVIGSVIFLVWFLPKYSYIQKNPGYCVALTKNLYYCGDKSNIGEIYNDGKKTKPHIDQTKEIYDEVNSSLNP